MTRIRTLAVAGILACGVALASCAESEGKPRPPLPKTHTVNMEGMVFRPKAITVAVGDTIVWVNKDLVPHTATSQAAGFDSASIPAYASWQTRLDRAGDYEYVCSFHPNMKATLQVR